MFWTYLVIVIYAIIAFGFFSAIQFERVKHAADFNWFQVLVALVWPAWAAWYGWVLFSDYRKKKNG